MVRLVRGQKWVLVGTQVRQSQETVERSDAGRVRVIEEQKEVSRIRDCAVVNIEGEFIDEVQTFMHPFSKGHTIRGQALRQTDPVTC